MELLESNDLKSELLRKSAKHRGELEEEVKLISERTEKVIINALIIGSTLATAYFLVRQFSGSKTKRKSRKVKIVNATSTPDEGTEEVIKESSAPGIVTQIGTALASQAGVFLLTLAKEKLTEYLEAQADKKAKNKVE